MDKCKIALDVYPRDKAILGAVEAPCILVHTEEKAGNARCLPKADRLLSSGVPIKSADPLSYAAGPTTAVQSQRH